MTDKRQGIVHVGGELFFLNSASLAAGVYNQGDLYLLKLLLHFWLLNLYRSSAPNKASPFPARQLYVATLTQPRMVLLELSRLALELQR